MRKNPVLTSNAVCLAECGLSHERGSCTNYTVRWAFDSAYGECSRFWFGGCDGNGNNFETKEECRQGCVHPDVEIGESIRWCIVGEIKPTVFIRNYIIVCKLSFLSTVACLCSRHVQKSFIFFIFVIGACHVINGVLNLYCGLCIRS